MSSLKACSVVDVKYINIDDQQGLGRLVRRQILLKATKYRKLWKAMIIHFLKEDGTYKKDYKKTFLSNYSIHF